MVMGSTTEDQQWLDSILFKHLHEKTEELSSGLVKFSQYTSADTALRIIRGKEVWFRNARLMNDFSEIRHGQDCLTNAWHNDVVGSRFRKLLDKIDPNLRLEIEKIFDETQGDRYAESYLLSVSEHHLNAENGHEDLYGRLSMWRAYGGNCNVAFVFHPEQFQNDDVAVDAFTSPVLYRDVKGFLDWFSTYVEAIENHWQRISGFNKDYLKERILRVLHFAVLSLKHPGFEEEREWRVIVSPTLTGQRGLSRATEVVGGIPQIVYKMKLDSNVRKGIVGVPINSFLSKIIIGPSEYPYAVRDALVQALADAGIDDPSSKVSISDIPLRR
jgi:Protein of unknown function (DUF2971)